jgi:protein required for attachment to host cells
MIATRVVAVADGEELVLYEADFAEQLVSRVASAREAMTNDGNEREESGDGRGRRRFAADPARSFIAPREP